MLTLFIGGCWDGRRKDIDIDFYEFYTVYCDEKYEPKKYRHGNKFVNDNPIQEQLYKRFCFESYTVNMELVKICIMAKSSMHHNNIFEKLIEHYRL